MLLACNSNNTKTAASQDTTAKTAADTVKEDFDVFFKKFQTDSAFQFTRIVFPLKLNTIGEEDSVTRYINKADWSFTNLAGDEKSKATLKKIAVSKNQLNIQFLKEDAGRQVDHFFIAKKGKWFLEAIRDESD